MGTSGAVGYAVGHGYRKEPAMGQLVTIPLTGIALGVVGADGVEELPLVSITLKAEGEGVSLYEVLVRRGDMLLDVADAAPGTNVDDWVMLGLTTA